CDSTRRETRLHEVYCGWLPAPSFTCSLFPGSKNFFILTWWSADDLNAISRELENIALPSEIHRKFRKLDDIKYWKGSEYSSFLHYASLVILQDRLSPEAYNHFMLFFCAVTILSSKFYKRLWSVAGQMLKHFVADFAKIYGEGYC
uniref:Uncharacterized protein n=1 Tax=Anopheles arabiensis TaxID=7173 RepID=A0A182IEN9_ANOAR